MGPASLGEESGAVGWPNEADKLDVVQDLFDVVTGILNRSEFLQLALGIDTALSLDCLYRVRKSVKVEEANSVLVHGPVKGYSGATVP
jgi:hypothetical protein